MTDQFTYPIGDKSITLPLLGGMSMGIAREIRNMGLSEAIFTMVEDYLDEDGLALFDTLPQSELPAFVKAWREASGISLGESAAS